MRIKTGVSFNQRPVPARQRLEYQKVFIVAEGEKTEPLYFDAIKKKFDIRDQIVVLQSSYSNPSQIFNDICRSLDAKGFAITPLSLLNDFYRYFGVDNDSIDYKQLRSRLDSFIGKKGIKQEDEISDDMTQQLIKRLLPVVSADNLFSYYYSKVKEGARYDDAIDEVYLVVDRDYKSFTEKQFDAVISEAPKRKINVILTNPCIEFFYLLHYDQVLSVDLVSMKSNDYVNKKRKITFAFSELKKVDLKYKKNKVDAEKYIQLYSKAKVNFINLGLCSDLFRLKHEVGTNMFDLCDLLFGLPLQS